MGEEVKARGTARVRIDADADDVKVVTARPGTATAYYGGQSVSSTNYTGTLAAGASLTLTQTTFFVTSGTHTRLLVGEQDRSLVGVEHRVDRLETDLAVTKEAPLNVQQREYGAVGDGSTDDTAAFAAWLTALNAATGAEGIVPHGTYVQSAVWNMDDFTDVSILGMGSRSTPPVAGGGGPQIVFNQAGAGDCVSLDEARSVNVDALRFVVNNAAFTGKVANLDSAATDGQFITFNYCGFYVNTGTPAAHISLDRVNTIRFRECGIYGAVLGVLGHYSTFAIACLFESCTFQNNTTQHVWNGGEAWKFDNCIFEPLANGKPGAYDHAEGVTSIGLHYDGCWFGDVSSAVGNPAWITFAGDNLSLNRNEMWSETAGAKHIVVDENDCNGIYVARNNTFHGPGSPIVDFGSTTGHTNVKINPANIDNVAVEVAGLTLPSVASAATVTLPSRDDVIAVTGTTNITSVAAAPAGRTVTLVFADVLTFTDGSNLKLAGNFVTSADDAITLVSDGTNWIETNRSAN